MCGVLATLPAIAHHPEYLIDTSRYNSMPDLCISLHFSYLRTHIL